VDFRELNWQTTTQHRAMRMLGFAAAHHEPVSVEKNMLMGQVRTRRITLTGPFPVKEDVHSGKEA
jgi:hypothetical protein